MATKYSIREISQLHKRDVFVDTNVLIYLFWPIGDPKWENIYASVYAKLLKQHNSLYVDFLVISEVVNRAFKTVYEKQKISGNTLNYKQFRNSEEGQVVLSEVYIIVEHQILQQFDVIGNTFSKTDILRCLTVDSLDFMDKGILKICQDNGFVLLTNDKDFKDSDIDILTCNSDILNN
ncbi:MAG: PIN domain-containing protein [Dysgonamonadaceae bacterium]|jgi:predicted nucleic acid-binding protein|nr:PIN domain-containing protein [Dysgonamonadaceae bacterium]